MDVDQPVLADGYVVTFWKAISDDGDRYASTPEIAEILRRLHALTAPEDLNLPQLQHLCGQASWKIRGQDHASVHDVATPDMIRQLPAGFGLVIRGGYAPVIARLPRAWSNPVYRRVRREPLIFPVPELTGPAEPGPDASPDHMPPGRRSRNGPSFPWS